jgi:hypothetical protein
MDGPHRTLAVWDRASDRDARRFDPGGRTLPFDNGVIWQAV